MGDFMSLIKKGAGAPVKAAKKAASMSGTILSTPARWKASRRGYADVNKIMKKFYPSNTVVGNSTWNTRRKEFKKMYDTKGPKAVIAKAKELKEQFRQDNP